MKEWLQQTVAGNGAAEGSVQQALLDLIWMMPWWAPYLILAIAGLWLLCLGLARLRTAQPPVQPRSAQPRSAQPRSAEHPAAEASAVERSVVEPVVKRSPKRLRLVA